MKFDPEYFGKSKNSKGDKMAHFKRKEWGVNVKQKSSKTQDAIDYSTQLGNTSRPRRLMLQMSHGVCKRSIVVRVKDVPPRIPYSQWGSLIEKVYTLPKGQGLQTPTMHDHGMAKRRAFSIHQRGTALGKPVTCLVRFTGLQGGATGTIGWRVFVFRRTDVTKKRNGREHKG